MTIINNKKDWDKFYVYKGYKPSKYPKKYPCYATTEVVDCGLMGDDTEHLVIYLPKNFKNMTKEEAFLAGMKQEWKYIC